MDFKKAISLKWKEVSEVSPMEAINIVLPDNINLSIPKNENNMDYVELMKQVDAGEVTIEKPKQK